MKNTSLKMQRLVVLFLFLIALLAVSCGTLEIALENTSTPGETVTPTSVVLATEDTDPATQEATPSPPLILAATELRVAFVKDTEHGNNVWLWTEDEREAIPLTKDGGVGNVKISDDGEIVAFTRGDGLWMVKSDGTDERHLVSADEFTAMESREAGFEVALNRFDWVPGTHVLAFNTRLRTEIGLILNDDLHLVNADTLERTDLLPPGEGGEFHYSPDGRQVAVVTRGTISLMNADGSNQREAFTYTPVSTHSEVAYYAEPVWAANSDSLRVAIPPADPIIQPSPPTSVWHILPNGTPARMWNIATGQMKPSVISPDLRYVAHLHYEQTDAASFPMSSLLITDLNDGETVTYYPQTGSGETTSPYPEATLIYGWSPDSQHLAFLANLPDLAPQVQIGRLGGDIVPVYDDADVIIDMRWVDADRYLFLAQNPRGWDIMLGEISGPVKNLAFVSESPPIYDFATPPYDTTTSAVGTPPPSDDTSTLDDSGDSSIPFGLIYRTADGLWHVNADGESTPILDRYGTLSPDSTRVLYDESDDIWLADVSTGERRNLTQTPDRVECCAQWWPGRSDIILFSSKLPENEGPNFGFPAVVQLDGSGYQVLDDTQVSFALPAPSPDGQTAAYDKAGQAWLYRPDTGPEPFDLTPFGLSNDPQLRVVSPAWSADGRQIAWVIGDCRQGDCQYGIGVFDLDAETFQLLHPYTPAGRGGQPSAPLWSPDGRWLAFIPWESSTDRMGLWVAQADGQQEYHFAQSFSPVWSPDGRWLAFGSTPQGLGSGIWLVEVGTWDPRSLNLPDDAHLVGWANPLP